MTPAPAHWTNSRGARSLARDTRAYRLEGHPLRAPDDVAHPLPLRVPSQTARLAT
jgi:hypothetical protein